MASTEATGVTAATAMAAGAATAMAAMVAMVAGAVLMVPPEPTVHPVPGSLIPPRWPAPAG